MTASGFVVEDADVGGFLIGTVYAEIFTALAVLEVYVGTFIHCPKVSVLGAARRFEDYAVAVGRAGSEVASGTLLA